jgi:hypothetical protein
MLRILILPCILLSTITGVKAQNIPKENWDWQKKWFDSIAQGIDTNPKITQGTITGTCSAGNYNATCFYNKAKKEIVKIRYTFTGDSMSVKTAYYNNSLLIKFIDSNTSYYSAVQYLVNEQGEKASQDKAKYLTGILDESWPVIYAVLFK